MKRQLLLALTMVLLSASLSAQHERVRRIAVQNDENAPFFFTVIQRNDAAFERLTASAAGALEVLRQVPELEAMVPPMGVAPELVPAGEGYLVGLYVRPGSTAYPVAVVPIGPFGVAELERQTVVVSRDHIVRDAEGRDVTVRPWHARLGEEPILLDNRYLDWEPVLPLARFSERFRPSWFVVETGRERRYQAIDESLFWGRGGTRLDRFRAVAGERSLYFNVQTHSRLERGTSILLFMYERIDDSAARYTLEVPLTGDAGWVLLWRQGLAEPEVVGNYIADAFVLEAQIRYDLLPASVRAFPVDRGFVDLATSFLGAGRHEEFFHARVYLSSIPGL